MPAASDSPITSADPSASRTTAAERRRAARYTALGRAVAVVHDPAGAAVGLWGVELLDSSAVGLGLRSPRRAAPGATVALHFGGEFTSARRGVVARCERLTDDRGGYLLGLNTWSRSAPPPPPRASAPAGPAGPPSSRGGVPGRDASGRNARPGRDR